jgi:hypothetical protein
MAALNTGFDVAATGKRNLASNPSAQLNVFQIKQLCNPS